MTEDQQVESPTEEEDTNEQYYASDYDTEEENLYATYYYVSDDGEDNDILTRGTFHQETQTLGYQRGINRLDTASPRLLQVFKPTHQSSTNYIDIATMATAPVNIEQALAAIATLQGQLTEA